MENLGKNRRLLIRIALDGGDIFIVLDVTEERVFADFAEVPGKADKVVIGECLPGKSEHLVLKPAAPDIGHKAV